MNKSIKKISLNGTGTEIPTIDVLDAFEVYYITGTATAIGNYAIAPTGTPKLGTSFKFNYDGVLDITTNSTTFTLFGTTIVQQQLIKPWTAEVYYNGTSWDVLLKMDFSANEIVITNNIQDLAVTTSKINNLAVTTAKIDNLAVTTGKIADLNVTTAKIDDLAVTTAKLDDDAVTTVKILDSNVTTAKVQDNAITNVKLATMADQTLKGNISGGVAIPSDISIGNLFSANAWLLNGNSGTTPGTNFLGTTDNVGLMFKSNNIQSGYIDRVNINTSFGFQSMLNNSTGQQNTAFGNSALNNNSSGDNNTAIGQSALLLVTSGDSNTSVGNAAGNLITTGSNNTIIGQNADVSSNSSSNRIALGKDALATQDFQFALPDNVTELKAVGIASIKIDALPSYNDNAAALLGGLTAGELFAASGGGTIAQGIVCQVY